MVSFPLVALSLLVLTISVSATTVSTTKPESAMSSTATTMSGISTTTAALMDMNGSEEETIVEEEEGGGFEDGEMVEVEDDSESSEEQGKPATSQIRKKRSFVVRYLCNRNGLVFLQNQPCRNFNSNRRRCSNNNFCRRFNRRWSCRRGWCGF